MWVVSPVTLAMFTWQRHEVAKNVDAVTCLAEMVCGGGSVSCPRSVTKSPRMIPHCDRACATVAPRLAPNSRSGGDEDGLQIESCACISSLEGFRSGFIRQRHGRKASVRDLDV